MSRRLPQRRHVALGPASAHPRRDSKVCPSPLRWPSPRALPIISESMSDGRRTRIAARPGGRTRSPGSGSSVAFVAGAPVSVLVRLPARVLMDPMVAHGSRVSAVTEIDENRGVAGIKAVSAEGAIAVALAGASDGTSQQSREQEWPPGWARQSTGVPLEIGASDSEAQSSRLCCPYRHPASSSRLAL